MKKQPRILIISTEFPPAPGGIGSHAFAMAKGLNGLGWKVMVATEQNYTGQEEIDQFNLSQAFAIKQLRPTPSVFKLFGKVFILLSLVIKFRPKYICGTGKHGAWFSFLFAKLFFKKLVLIGHGTEFTISMSERSKKINKYVYSHASLLICVSEFTKSVVESVGILNKRSIVIHNGADPENYNVQDGESIQKFKVAEKLLGQKIIITVGAVTYRKGQEWVIRSMPGILEREPNVHYYCIGAPTITTELKSLAIELNVDNHVHFLGKIPTSKVVQWLNASDVYVMSSVHQGGDFEGFGISVIEAALCSKPAIVTNESGAIESIEDGVTGFGVPERDSLAIQQKIIHFFEHPEIRVQMGIMARERALKQFVWPKVIEQYSEEILQL